MPYFLCPGVFVAFLPDDKIQATKAQSHNEFLFNVPVHKLLC